MGNYQLSQAAKKHLRKIYIYDFENWGEAVADVYYNALLDHFEKIAEQPYLYPSVDYIHEGYRRSVCGEESTYYRIDGDMVEIVAVLGSQDTDPVL